MDEATFDALATAGDARRCQADGKLRPFKGEEPGFAFTIVSRSDQIGSDDVKHLQTILRENGLTWNEEIDDTPDDSKLPFDPDLPCLRTPFSWGVSAERAAEHLSRITREDDGWFFDGEVTPEMEKRLEWR